MKLLALVSLTHASKTNASCMLTSLVLAANTIKMIHKLEAFSSMQYRGLT